MLARTDATAIGPSPSGSEGSSAVMPITRASRNVPLNSARSFGVMIKGVTFTCRGSDQAPAVTPSRIALKVGLGRIASLAFATAGW